MESIWQIFGYFLLPALILIISFFRDIPKARVILLSALPALLFGVIFTIFGIRDGIETLFGTIFIPFLIYASFYPFLLFMAFLYLEFLIKLHLYHRVFFVFILGLVSSTAYIFFSFQPKATPFDGVFIIISSATLGALSVFIDYWIWERAKSS